MPSSTTPFFGRAYALTITPNQGPSAGVPIVVASDAMEPHSLRFSFDISQFAFSAFWQAEIVIYNADGEISGGPSKGVNLYQAVIQENDMVSVCAGYQSDYPWPAVPPTIWVGPIFYTIQDRVDVVDRRLVIRCLLNRMLTTQNLINTGIPAMRTQFEQARTIAALSQNKIFLNEDELQKNLNNATPQRGAQQLPRGKTYFGRPDTYLTALAEQNNLLSWFDSKGWNNATLQYPTGQVKATYAPVIPRGGPPARVGGVTLSLIGQPQQTQLGCDFRVLLDPTVQVEMPLPRVIVQKQWIRQAPIQYPLPQGQGPPRPIADSYVVVGVRFIGDTRGNPWYSQITGVAQITEAVQLLGQSTQVDATQN